MKKEKKENEEEEEYNNNNNDDNNNNFVVVSRSAHVKFTYSEIQSMCVHVRRFAEGFEVMCEYWSDYEWGSDKKLQVERPHVAECVRCRVPHPGVSNRVGQYKCHVGFYSARSEADVDSGILGYAAG